MALHLLPVLSIGDVIRLQRRRFGSWKQGIHHERAVTNVDLKKLAGDQSRIFSESYMLVRIFDILIIHTVRDEPCRQDSRDGSRFAELARKQAIKSTLDEFGAHGFWQKVR